MTSLMITFRMMYARNRAVVLAVSAVLSFVGVIVGLFIAENGVKPTIISFLGLTLFLCYALSDHLRGRDNG